MTIFEDLAVIPTTADYSNRLEELKSWLAARDEINLDVNDPVLVSALLGPLAELLADDQAVLDSLDTYGRLSSNIFNSITDESQAEELRQVLAASLDVEESPAGYAIGEIRVVVSTGKSVVIPQGSRFTSQNNVYQTTSSYILRNSDEQVGDSNERSLILQSSGDYAGIVPVSAVTPGSGGNIAAGTGLQSEQSIDSLVSILASTNFVGGRDANSLQDLLDAVFANTAARTTGSRDQITAFLQTRSSVGSIRQVGVIGFGDPELLRDKHAFLPLHGGGKADIFLASEFYPTEHTVVLEATVTTVGEREVLTIPIGRDVSPGYLRIVSITSSLSGDSYVVDEEVRGYDDSPILGEQVPYIVGDYAGFSRFQAATVTAGRSTPDDSGLSSAGDTFNVEVVLQRVPGIDAAQTEMTNRTNRYTGGDVLVRSAIPIFLTIRIRLTSTFETEVPASASIAEAVASEVMRRPMRPTLFRSDIVQAIGRYLPDDLAVESIEYEGDLIRPDGTREKLTQEGNFDCPDRPEDQITARTAAMYTTASKVNISITQRVTNVTP